MSTKTTLTTFALAILAVVAAVMTSGSDRPGGAAMRGPAPLFQAEQLPLDSIRRMTVAKRNGERLVFERIAAGTWMQIEPFAHAMDAYRMRQLAAAALEVQIADRLSPDALRDGLTFATLGLDPPEATITYEWNDESRTIAFGRRGIAGRAYLRMDGSDDVLIVTQQLHQRVVETDPREWRDRTIFRGVSVDCDRIERVEGNARVVIERDRRAWRIIEPVQTRADRDGVEAFMQALGRARTGGFISDQPRDPSRFGLAPPAGSITVTCAAAAAGEDGIARVPQEQKLLIGIPAGAGTQDRFAMIEGRPTVFRLPLETMQGLFKGIEGLIDPTGSGAQAADVKSVRILSEAGEVRLERDLEKWRFAQPSPATEDAPHREAPADRVEDLLTKLTTFRASEVSIEEYPADLEVAVITLHGFDGRPMDTVRVLHHADSGAWGLENGDGVVRVFQRGFAIPLTPADFGVVQTE